MKIKLMLGDCLEQLKKIPDNFVDLIITDPPYGISYSSRGGPRVSKKRKNSIAKNTRILGDDAINPLWFNVMEKKLKSSGAMYVFCNFVSFVEHHDG